MMILSDCLTEQADEGCAKVASTLTRLLQAGFPNARAVRYGEDRLPLSRLRKEPILYIPLSSNTRGGVLRTFLLSRLSHGKVTALFALCRPMDRLTRMLLKRSGAKVLCLSGGSHEYYRGILGERAIRLKTGVDTNRFAPVTVEVKRQLRKKFGISCDKKVVLHVGHLKEGRNVGQLLNIPEEFEVLLVVSTTTAGQQDKVLRHKLEQRPNITIIDTYLPDIQELYQLSDVYFFPVLMPGNCIDVPLSVLEAAACGLPVLTTRYGELTEFEGKAGFYYLDSFESGEIGRLLAEALSVPCDTRTAVMPYDWSLTLKRIGEACGI